MEPVSKLLIKFSQRLFKDSSDQEKFIDALIHPQPFNPCILWCKPQPSEIPFQREPALPWQPEFVDRLAIAEKPGQHSLHQQGFYYCLDFSSVFAASILLTIQTPIQLVVDVCASPGGKSLFMWRSLRPQCLMSNEVIGKRMGALVSNLKRCAKSDDPDSKLSTKIAFSLDSKILAQELAKIADLVLVDAPCTGQSLLAKGDKSPGCFHPVNINKNANRQKRIIANSAQVVSPQGYLAYMTCAYSLEENEQVMDWFLERFPAFQPISVSHLQDYQSNFSDLPCYRIFPQGRLGAGAFTVLFQNTELSEKHQLSNDFLNRTHLISI
ncbi:MAG TPA: RsmB/NOP family class I SAM-dependent RNA methyltransferase [Crinalium sp.]